MSRFEAFSKRPVTFQHQQSILLPYAKIRFFTIGLNADREWRETSTDKA